MKSIAVYLLLFFGASILLQSCSIEKRRYNKGYHISKKGILNSTEKIEKEERTALNSTPIEIENRIEVLEKAELTSVDVDSKNDQATFLTEIAGSTEDNIKLSDTQVQEEITEVASVNVPTYSKKVVKKAIKNANDNSGGGTSPALAFGIILVIIGIAFLLFLSLLIGLLMIILGVILLAVGASKKATSPKEKSNTLVEVVYLKNGSMIRGTIIEQIPNESLKIQTADGSVFVYKMSEVLKITKEPSN